MVSVGFARVALTDKYVRSSIVARVNCHDHAVLAWFWWYKVSFLHPEPLYDKGYVEFSNS
jgi:hypothetical protein